MSCRNNDFFCLVAGKFECEKNVCYEYINIVRKGYWASALQRLRHACLRFTLQIPISAPIIPVVYGIRESYLNHEDNFNVSMRFIVRNDIQLSNF